MRIVKALFVFVFILFTSLFDLQFIYFDLIVCLRTTQYIPLLGTCGGRQSVTGRPWAGQGAFWPPKGLSGPPKVPGGGGRPIEEWASP